MVLAMSGSEQADVKANDAGRMSESTLMQIVSLKTHYREDSIINYST